MTTTTDQTITTLEAARAWRKQAVEQAQARKEEVQRELDAGREDVARIEAETWALIEAARHGEPAPAKQEPAAKQETPAPTTGGRTVIGSHPYQPAALSADQHASLSEAATAVDRGLGELIETAKGPPPNGKKRGKSP